MACARLCILMYLGTGYALGTGQQTLLGGCKCLWLWSTQIWPFVGAEGCRFCQFSDWGPQILLNTKYQKTKIAQIRPHITQIGNFLNYIVGTQILTIIAGGATKFR